MVATYDKASFFRGRQDSFKFGTDCFFAFTHYHFIKSADVDLIRVVLPEYVDICPSLPFKWENPLNSGKYAGYE